ncbi:MAG: hypothetical protein LiPW41_659 [Parcubacteria group bacterium LiPW_41]|nr:MAG: hypothetical protein LiPW41_659 [Parcubacteria group bacterium LiPW_41]
MEIFKKDGIFSSKEKPVYEIEEGFKKLIMDRASEKISDRLGGFVMHQHLNRPVSGSDFFSLMESNNNIFSPDEVLSIIKRNTEHQPMGGVGFLDDKVRNVLIARGDKQNNIIVTLLLTEEKKWKLQAEEDEYAILVFQQGLNIFGRNLIKQF